MIRVGVNKETYRKKDEPLKKRKIAVVGLGDIAEKAYLPVVAAHPALEITGIMSRKEETVERIGAQYRIPVRCTDLAELLRTEPEAVFIHSPTETHYGIAMECLRQGRHVYVDKPLSYRIRESEAMAEQADKYGRLLAVGFNRRFAPMVMQAKGWMEEAGGFHLCSADKHRSRQQRHGAKETLYDDLIHMIDLLVWLGGSKAEPAYAVHRSSADGRLSFAQGSLRLGDEGTGTFAMDRFAGCDLERLELHGGGRSVQVTDLETAVFWDKAGGSITKRFGSWDPVAYRRGFQGAVEHFLEGLDRPEACGLAAQQTINTHRLVERIADLTGIR